MLASISYPPIPIFRVGPISLSLHGIFAALGFILGARQCTRNLAARGMDTVKFQSVLTWGLIGSLVGARYLTSPAALLAGGDLGAALNPFGGNFSILGGFAGGILAGAYRMKKTGLPVLATLDAVAPGLALGTVIGRIGDLAIVEHLGRATSVPFGYGIKPGYDVAPVHDSLECIPALARPDGLCGVYHHVALYDLIGAAVLIWFLYWVWNRFSLRAGQHLYLWVVWYGLQRFALDSLRVGSGDAQIGAVTWNQLSGLAAALAGAVMFVYLGRKRPSLAQPATDH